MEVVEQHAPLTMGWCINCHRTTNVNDANPYYEKIHEQLAKKYGKEKLTIAELGGLECSWQPAPAWQFDAWLRRLSRVYVNDANTATLPAYATLDLSAAWQASP